MIRLSANVLDAVVSFLRQVFIRPEVPLSYRLLSKINGIAATDIWELATTCEWCEEKDAFPILLESGKTIASLAVKDDYEAALRMLLRDYILQANPTWANRIPSGRKECIYIMKKDEQACFNEAGLLADHMSMEIIEWWDDIAGIIRSRKDAEKSETGRRGELASIEYEKHRTKQDPVWMSFDSNYAGYDILSVIDKDDQSQMLIEVKASMRPVQDAAFHVTAHEWEVAKTSDHYFFYLWSFSEGTKRLAAICAAEVEPYIPIDRRTGRWESAEIPYNSFASQFNTIP